MKTSRSVKPPLYSLTLFPLLSIAGFSFFVVWQWWPISLDPLLHSDPLDQAASFSSLSLPGNNPATNSSHVVGGDDADKSTRIKSLISEGVVKCCECGAPELRIKNRMSLLHNWTDDELYTRVIADELGRKPPGRRINCSKIDIRWPGRSTRHRLRSGSTESCRSFCARINDTGFPVVAGGKVKIAFLFMITASLPFEPLWNEFFKGKEGLFNIYVHTDPFDPNLFSQSSALFWNRLIPSQKAYRGSPSLVQASNRLVANAMLDDPANGYFALLSGQCIPVASFSSVYRSITSSRRSFLEQIMNETVMVERYSGREGGEEIMLPEIPFDQFRKAAQWFVFVRPHALMVLQDVHQRKYWGKFDHPCVIYFCGTDEHYYPTFFNIVDPDGVTGSSATYVRWPDYVSEHPVTFYREDVNTELIMDIQSMNDGQYLFARKFGVDTIDLLMNITDTILR